MTYHINFSNIQLSSNFQPIKNDTVTTQCFDWCKDTIGYAISETNNSGLTLIILAFIFAYVNSAIIKHNAIILEKTQIKEETLTKAIPILNDGAMIFIIFYIIYRLWFV